MRTNNLDHQNKQPENEQPEIWPFIIAWGKGHQPSGAQQKAITTWELGDPDRAKLWHLNTDRQTLKSNQQVTQALNSRAALLQSVVQGIETHPETQSLPVTGPWTDWIVPLWTFWLPLAQQLDQKQRALKAPFIQGILGGQGTGKTTLTQILNLILNHLGQRSAGLSIDDLYLTYAQRLTLQKQDPRFLWRGPPGTHDIQLGLQTLAHIKQATSTDTVMLPQFDKSRHEGQGDRTTPLTIKAPSIVLFEGWFVGTRPVDDAIFDTVLTGTNGTEISCKKTTLLPEPIVSEGDRQFAADCNRLLRDYLPLWGFLDSLIVLSPVDYRLSGQWRQQAEHDMKAQGRNGLSDEAITDFVTYFWKALHPDLFITPLVDPKISDAKSGRTATGQYTTDLVVTIQADHSLGRLYQPGHGQPHALAPITAD